MGRLLIPLYLVNRQILKRLILYLSDFFEGNRTLYYDNLMRVRERNELPQWFKFFLVGMIETAKSGIAHSTRFSTSEGMEERVQTPGSRTANAAKVIRYLYQRPLIDAEKVSQVTGVSLPSSYKLIKDME